MPSFWEVTSVKINGLLFYLVILTTQDYIHAFNTPSFRGKIVRTGHNLAFAHVLFVLLIVQNILSLLEAITL